jgi:hypothetical protein
MEVLKDNTQNTNSNMSSNSEFKNSRVPLDGIELLLNRDKVPNNLGKKMENEDELISDLDDIISESEASEKFSGGEERRRERLKRRIKKKNSSIPTARFNISSPSISVVSPTIKPSPVLLDDTKHSVGQSRIDTHFEKKKVQEEEDDEEEEEDDEDEEDDEEEYDDDEDEEEEEEVPSYEKKWKHPSQMSRDEIVSEKMDLLYRYSRLSENGYKSGLDLNIKTPLETLRSEVFNLEKMRNTQRAIRTQRKLLISFTGGVEYVNKRYSPYKLSLDGWSGEVLENIGDYDEVFEELHEKYSDSMNVPPELRLIAMVGGSGLMFHLSNTLFKSSTPELSDILERNPEIRAQIQQEALRSMAQKNAGDPMFNMMMGGLQDRNEQRSMQQEWKGRPGYSPPRTSSFPQASNSSQTVGVNINEVPRQQGVVNQRVMSGPSDDILSELNSSDSGLISDIEEQPVKRVSTRRKKKNNVIDLDN